MKFFNHPEGYVEPDGSGGYDYVYQYKDHLGNIRLSYSDSNNDGIAAVSEILQEKNYYPFGLKHRGYNNVVNGTHYPFDYNGKENNQELGLNWHDFGARNYDAALGRWMNMDPLAEAMRRHSPYNYAFDNPVYYIDPDGMMPYSIGNEDLNNKDTGPNFERGKPHYLASTVVDGRGKIIDHKDDGDPGIYLNTRDAQNLIGFERPGVDYSRGYLTEDDLIPEAIPNLPKGFWFFKNLNVIYFELPWYLGGPKGIWKMGTYLGYFARLKVLLNGGTLKITVQILANVKGKANLIKVLKGVEAEAKAAGAKKLVIEGVEILNTKLLNVKVFERLGFTAEKITDTTIKITKNL